MSDGPKIIINSADVPATARLRFRFTTDNCVIPGGTVKIESHDGTSWRVVPDKTATVTATCARCSATIDPATVEQHHEMCFVVGDWVRWTFGDGWVEGEVKEPQPGHVRLMTAVRSENWRGAEQAIRDGKDVYPGGYGTIRHIQRPGQAGRDIDPFEARAAAYHKLASEAPGPIGCAHGDDDDDELQDAMEAMEDFTPILPPEVYPLDVKYDGVTLRELVGLDVSARRELSNPIALPGVHTPAQRAAVSAHWSAQLRARISAAKERERLSVTYCEVDAED